MKATLWRVAAGCALVAVSTIAQAQPRIVLLGSGLAAGVKADGSVVAGGFSAGPLLTIGSTVSASSLPGFGVAACTPDFAYFAGSTSSGPARWNSATATAQTIPAAPSLAGSKSVTAISANGRYVAGWGYQSGSLGAFKPWVWDAAAGGGTGATVALPTSAGNGQAKVVGSNGVVAGVDGCCGSANRPAIWTFDSGSGAWVESFLPFDGGASPLTGGDVFAMNASGTVIIGSIALASGNLNMAKWYWSGATQSWSRQTVDLSAMARPSWLSAGYNTTQFIPTAVSDDGNTVVGITVYTNFGNFQRGGFTWKASTGLATDFYDDLVALNAPGIDALGPFDAFSPPALGFAVAMTGDGQHIATYAGPQTGFGPPTLVDLSGGPCVTPTAGAVNSSSSIAAGENAYLNCSITGSQPLSIQWRFNGTPIFDGPSGTGSTYYGATGHAFIGNQLLVHATSPADSGSYDCVVTNACRSATRPALTLIVNSGACCYSSGGVVVCTIEGSSVCTSSLSGGLNGAYRGDNTACTPTICDAVSGACCSWSDGVVCAIDISSHCITSVAGGGAAGVYLGNTTACISSVCDTVSGACCYSGDGFSSVQCTVELSSRCTQAAAPGLAGAFAGNSTACAAGDTCPPGTAGIGACCFNATPTTDILCSVHVSSHCTATYTNGGLQGKYEGDGVACGASTCRPSLFGTGGSLGACSFTDPNNPASGPLCVITYIYNCSNYPNGSNDANAAPFNTGLGGNFYTNTCCGPSSASPISGCSTSVNPVPAEGACIHAPFDNSTGVACTIQVRASRCTRRYNAGGLFGTWIAGTTVCSPAVLAANSGACCYQPTTFNGAPTGCPVCTVQAQDRCTTSNNGGLGGVYAGNGTSCTPVAQCPAQYGACCTLSGTTVACAVVARSACTGSLVGLNVTSCVAAGCPLAAIPDASGACCNPTTLACTTSVQTACPSPKFWLYNTACTNSNPCESPATGACCALASCSVTCQSDCAASSGIFQGSGTACSPTNPCLPAGVCCRGATCVTAVASAAACMASLNGNHLAGAAFSATASCNVAVNSRTPCCHADYNKINGISVQDIFDFLNDWFAGSPFAAPGGDGVSGTLSVQNIFDYLNMWFAGGC